MSPENLVNILAVDDDPANLLALESTLAGPHRRIIRASSGAEALRQILNHDFAVILLDVQMPGTNGIETAEAIRERERSRQIPIIFLTGLVQTDEMIFKGYGAGAVDYLIKPIRTEVLRAKVAVFVDLALAQQQLRQLNLELEDAFELGDRSADLDDVALAEVLRNAAVCGVPDAGFDLAGVVAEDEAQVRLGGARRPLLSA